MRIRLLSLAALCVVLGIGALAMGQVDPQNQGAAILQQLQENMNNAGVTPRDIIQQVGQQMQDGSFDPQAFRQQLQDSGIINQNMLDQFNQLRNQAQNQGQGQFRNPQRQMTSLQQVLNASDDEWVVLGPRIQRVMDINNDLNQAANTLQIQQRNIGFTVQQQQQTPIGPVAAALADLRNTLQDPNTPDSDLRLKLAAYRQARVKATSELATAQTDLLNYLTLRQEGILLNMLIVE